MKIQLTDKFKKMAETLEFWPFLCNNMAYSVKCMKVFRSTKQSSEIEKKLKKGEAKDV